MKLERIKEIYAELEKYVVELHPDPRALGPTYLNDLIARTRNHLNAVSRIQLEVHQQKQGLARDLRAHEAAYQVSADDLLANDDRVRRLPSIEDRKATVAVFLRAERQTIEGLKAAIQDIDYVDKAVRHRHKELTSTMSEIKLQRSLIRDEIDTGAMYGDERSYSDPRKPANPAFGDDMSEEELARLLEGTPEPPRVVPPVEEPKAEVSTSAPESPASEPEPAPVNTEVVTEEAVTAFLAGDVPDMAAIEDDFSEVFENL